LAQKDEGPASLIKARSVPNYIVREKRKQKSATNQNEMKEKTKKTKI